MFYGINFESRPSVNINKEEETNLRGRLNPHKDCCQPFVAAVTTSPTATTQAIKYDSRIFEITNGNKSFCQQARNASKSQNLQARFSFVSTLRIKRGRQMIGFYLPGYLHDLTALAFVCCQANFSFFSYQQAAKTCN